MKLEKTIAPFVLCFILGLLFLSGCATVGDTTSAGTSPAQQQSEKEAGITSVRNVILERIQGKERVSILLSDTADFEISRESDTELLITLRGVFVPEGTKKEYSADGLRVLQRAVLYNLVTEGEKAAGARLLLKRMVPYRYRKDGARVVVDFDVSALSYEADPDGAYFTQALPKPGTKGESRNKEPQPEKDSQYTGEEVSLDFQEADIKSVFRLLSEISGLSIIAGPDVKAEVTVHMKNVPWDQALDAVLEINGLGKKQSGVVITVLPLEKLKKAEEEQKKKDVAQGRLRQISIEAKIVEVNTTFAKELGVRWGAGLESGNFAMGMGSASSGKLTSIPGTGVGLTGSNVAVNFPSVATTGVTTPAIGLLFGTSKMILDAKLSALEATGDGKIISSPKVTTLDSVTATIKQGEEIPYTTTDSDGNTTTEFKDAVLKLEVTPTITHEGRVSIVVNASNDYAVWQTNTDGNRAENPAINTSSVESTVVLRDGDTIVIGGVYKTTEDETMSGVPWLSQIPVLGWLFKYKTVSNAKRELLIFVTPKIITEEE
ncbi:MAG: secretin and TonB N-terminal domain-containing protein [Deltaproteobacteria bacterium]|nr:secretin and TonB N-terminal domain-containing protein [Deltaproteobacteria bacterium]